MPSLSQGLKMRLRAAFTWGLAGALPLLVLMVACKSKARESVEPGPDGKHPTGWIVAHGSPFREKNESCVGCHGSYTDPAKGGGTSKVSCFTATYNGQACHAMGPKHPSGWRASEEHGRKGAMAAPGVYGFESCKVCHGKDFKSSKITSCYTCHFEAPHPSKPWHDAYVEHAKCDEGSIKVCAECHLHGENSSLKPPAPLPPDDTPLSCFNGTLCHGGGSGATHEASLDYLKASRHGVDARKNLSNCQICHASPSTGVDPRYNVPRNNMSKGCESCHPQNTAHPSPWVPGRGTTEGEINVTTHAYALNPKINCTPCHGKDLKGGGKAPSCMSNPLLGVACHGSSPSDKPSGCVSCHQYPPKGTAAPNQEGAHSAHLFANVTCDACHFQHGAGRMSHADLKVDVRFDSRFNAKSGAASYQAGSKTCSNVSCHGGQVTQPWYGGKLDVATQCAKCHQQGSTQHNSYKGMHQAHTAQNCLDCHDLAKLNPHHFTNLNTSTMEGPAASTVGGGSTKITSYQNYTCLSSCHQGEQTW